MHAPQSEMRSPSRAATLLAVTAAVVFLFLALLDDSHSASALSVPDLFDRDAANSDISSSGDSSTAYTATVETDLPRTETETAGLVDSTTTTTESSTEALFPDEPTTLPASTEGPLAATTADAATPSAETTAEAEPAMTATKEPTSTPSPDTPDTPDTASTAASPTPTPNAQPCSPAPLNAVAEKIASDFFAAFETPATALRRASAVAAFAFETNITDANLADSTATEEAANLYYELSMAQLKTALTLGGNLADVSAATVSANLCPTTARLVNIFLQTDMSSNATLRTLISDLVVNMTTIYSKTRFCNSPALGAGCFALEPELTALLADASVNASTKLAAWDSWHTTVGVSVRPSFEQFVTASNTAAKENGYADTGAYWRSGYDMGEAEFRQLIDGLWTQVQPLYNQLHCHVRRRLSAFYGPETVPLNKPIPAHLLGNMWAQTWSNVFDLVKPYPTASSPNVDAALLAKNLTALDLHRLSESFYLSLGFPALPDSFWSLSLFEKPEDRDVVCHASAWDLEYNDLRIKMCTVVTEEDLYVVHHEQGHLFYDQSYASQPIMFRQSANDGFHEAVGDTIRLSVSSPAHLAQIGLASFANLSEDELQKAVLNSLMKVALDKIAFLPFGYLLDKWRWEVFAEAVPPAEYNALWWQLRKDFQGIAPALPRPADAFDPGAKYHVSANVPYVRYFLAYIYQFQFHEALCNKAGYTGPLWNCTIYNSAAAGSALRDMLSLGASLPWPQALAVLTGSQNMTAASLLSFFQPLLAWLEEQNAGQDCAWNATDSATATTTAAAASETSTPGPSETSTSTAPESLSPTASLEVSTTSTAATPDPVSSTLTTLTATSTPSSAAPSTSAAASASTTVSVPNDFVYGSDLSSVYLMVGFIVFMAAFAISRFLYYRILKFLASERYRRDDEAAILADEDM